MTDERAHIAAAVAALEDRHALRDPDGRLDHDLYMVIRDTVRRYGYEAGRDRVARILNEIADGRRM